MVKLFKITFPNKESFIIANKKGWTGLARLLDYADFDSIPNPKETYIAPVSLWEFIKYIIKK